VENCIGGINRANAIPLLEIPLQAGGWGSMQRCIIALVLAASPAAMAQGSEARKAELEASRIRMFDYNFGELRFGMGWVSANDRVIRQMLESGAETGKGTPVCVLAEAAIRDHAGLKAQAAKMGARPDTSVQSPEWVRSRLAEIAEWEPKAAARRTQACT
jgi:hypothetical protein